MKHIAQERCRYHQFVKRTMKGGVVKVRYGFIPIAANLFVGMRGQYIMKKVPGCDTDGKHQQEHNGDNFLYDALFSQCKGLTRSRKMNGGCKNKTKPATERFGRQSLT